MPRGGKRDGAGRRKGCLGRKTLEIAKDSLASGLTPLEVMLKAMKVHAAAGRWDQAAHFAMMSAPFIHPRLATVQHSGAGGGPIETRDVTLPELARRIAFILGQASDVPLLDSTEEVFDTAN